MIDTFRYYRLKKSSLEKFRTRFNTFVPSPNKDDYKRGYITRFFVQKANDINNFIYEVNSEEFDNLRLNRLFSTVSLDWRITGDDVQIQESNKESLRLASRNIPKISLYLPNLLQFRKK